jgi:hypothetical protein
MSKALCDTGKLNPYNWQKVKMISNKIYVSDVPSIIKEEVVKYNKDNDIGKDRFSFFKKRRQ